MTHKPLSYGDPFALTPVIGKAIQLPKVMALLGLRLNMLLNGKKNKHPQNRGLHHVNLHSFPCSHMGEYCLGRAEDPK